jgi:hypothetical protein
MRRLILLAYLAQAQSLLFETQNPPPTISGTSTFSSPGSGLSWHKSPDKWKGGVPVEMENEEGHTKSGAPSVGEKPVIGTVFDCIRDAAGLLCHRLLVPLLLGPARFLSTPVAVVFSGFHVGSSIGNEIKYSTTALSKDLTTVSGNLSSTLREIAAYAACGIVALTFTVVAIMIFVR